MSTAFICLTCGAQFPPSAEPPPECPICTDSRQFVGLDGQQWTSLDKLSQKHRNIIEKQETNLYSIHTEPHFAIGEPNGQADDFGAIPDDHLRWTKLQFRSNNSTSRAFILALAAKHPHSLITGRAIDTAQVLSKYNKKEFHHIYPTAYLKRQKAPGQHNCLANICMLPAANNKEISDSDPDKYLTASIQGLGGQAEQVFASNFLPPSNAVDYSKADFPEFIKSRSTLLSQFIQSLCAGQRP